MHAVSCSLQNQYVVQYKQPQHQPPKNGRAKHFVCLFYSFFISFSLTGHWRKLKFETSHCWRLLCCGFGVLVGCLWLFVWGLCSVFNSFCSNISYDHVRVYIHKLCVQHAREMCVHNTRNWETNETISQPAGGAGRVQCFDPE